MSSECVLLLGSQEPLNANATVEAKINSTHFWKVFFRFPTLWLTVIFLMICPFCTLLHFVLYNVDNEIALAKLTSLDDCKQTFWTYAFGIYIAFSIVKSVEVAKVSESNNLNGFLNYH